MLLLLRARQWLLLVRRSPALRFLLRLFPRHSLLLLLLSRIFHQACCQQHLHQLLQC